MVLVESIGTSPRLEHTLSLASPKLASFGSPRMARRMSASGSPCGSGYGSSPLSPRLRHFKLVHSIPHPGCRLGTATSYTAHDVYSRKAMPASPELHDAWVNVIGPKLSPVDIVVLSTVNKWGHATAHSIMTHQGSIKWNAENLKDIGTLEHVAKHWPHLKMELDIWEDGLALKKIMDEVSKHEDSVDEPMVTDPSPTPTPAPPSSTATARTAAGAAALARAMAMSNTGSAVHLSPSSPPTHTQMVQVQASKPVWPVCQVALLRLVWCPVSRFDFVDASRLEQFHRVGPKLGMEARKSLEQMLLGCTRLEALTLSNCIDSEDDVKWLANALGRLTRLSHLDLRCNYLEADRAETLAPALAQLTNITSLDLGVNAFGAEGMQHLAPSLAKMTRMQELILQYNCMGSEGAKALAPSLAHMPQLTGLYLGENGMGVEGVQAVVPMLPHMPLLTHVNIEVRVLGAEARAGVRKMLPRVRDVDLW